MGSVGGSLRHHSASFMNLCSVFFMSRCSSSTAVLRVTYRPPAVTYRCCTPPVPLHCTVPLVLRFTYRPPAVTYRCCTPPVPPHCTVPLAPSFHLSHMTPCGCRFSVSCTNVTVHVRPEVMFLVRVRPLRSAKVQYSLFVHCWWRKLGL